MHKTRSLSEDLNVTVQQNLRIGMDQLSGSLHNARYGVPSPSLSSWVTWVTGFTANPLLAAGTGGAPDSRSIATRTLQPTTTLASAAAAGATSLTPMQASGLNSTTKRLIYINDNENALIQSVTGSTITMDTNPGTAGNQGLAKAYPAGTPLCRVDATTYTVSTSSKTLRSNANQGAGDVPIADGITNLGITTTAVGSSTKYLVTLTGQTSRIDPFTGSVGQATLFANITPR